MTPKQFEALLGHLNANQALLDKQLDLLSKAMEQLDTEPPKPKPHPKAPKPAPHEPEPELEQRLEDIPHKDEQIQSIMKLSDSELLERMFPDGTPPEET